MDDVVLFVHGTGVRDASATIAALRTGAARVMGSAAPRFVAVEWGAVVGPTAFDVAPALPPETGGRGLTDDSLDMAAVWDVLLADPSFELALVARSQPAAAPPLIDPTKEPVELALLSRLPALEVPSSAVDATGTTPADFSAAVRSVFADPAAAAAAAVDQDEAVAALARSVVARLHAYAPDGHIPAAARDALVQATAASLAPLATRGLGGDVLRRIVAPLASRLAVRHRARLMQPFGEFARDIAFYLAHGHLVRDHIATAIDAHADADLIVVLGHSLGGVAAVDLLMDPARTSGARRPWADLLVTAGSQAPLLQLCGALAHTGPAAGGLPAPWVNIYDRNDLLAFCAERVFAASDVRDEAVVSSAPFPASHSGYWALDRTYEILADALSRIGRPG